MKKHKLKYRIRKEINDRHKPKFILLLNTDIVPHERSVTV